MNHRVCIVSHIARQIHDSISFIEVDLWLIINDDRVSNWHDRINCSKSGALEAVDISHAHVISLFFYPLPSPRNS